MYKVTTNLDHIGDTYQDKEQTKDDILGENGIEALYICDTFSSVYTESKSFAWKFRHHGGE